jgi:hypothetical protein
MRLVKVNAKKTKSASMSPHQNLGHHCNIKVANISLENVAKFQYLGTTVTNRIVFRKELRAY